MNNKIMKGIFRPIEHINAICEKNEEDIKFYEDLQGMLMIIQGAVDKQVELETSGLVEENRFIVVTLTGCTKEHKYGITNYLGDLGYDFTVHSEDDKEIEAIDYLWQEWEETKDEMCKKMLDTYVDSHSDFILSWATQEWLDSRENRNDDDNDDD